MKKTNHFGQNIRCLRRARGMTQEALARATGLRQGRISGIERQIADPRDMEVGTVQALARGLGVGLEKLIGPA
jgi:transcriptional regulator with XRE-family HTH domain